MAEGLIKNTWILNLLFCLLFVVSVYAGEADIIDVNVKNEGDNRYTFNVTVRHDDSGWDHYADRWEILTTDGQFIGARTLMHPHVTEQPFTRSLPYVQIPIDINEVIIRGHCSVEEYGGEIVTVVLPRRY